jgi:hypothetical protein
VSADEQGRIVRLVPTGPVEEILDKPGGPLYGSPWSLPLNLSVLPAIPVAAVRAVAAQVAASRGRIKAASSAYDRWVEYEPTVNALNELAAAVESAPVDDWDIVEPTREEVHLVGSWMDRCDDRSALLVPLVECLGEIRDSADCRVVHARRAVALLADADLLLPGVDADLRPVLTRYAALPDGQVRK